MTRANHQCPECGTDIPLAALSAGQSDIKCPQCGVWFALPPRLRASEGGIDPSDEGHSNSGLWIGLAIGGGLLLLLAACGGVPAVYWLLRGERQQQQARQAERQGRAQAR